MNTAPPALYTNEACADFLRDLDKSKITENIQDTCNEEVLTLVRQQQEYRKAHPPIAIYRIAAQGSQTRNGGVVEQATSAMGFKLSNGQHVRAAQKGDYAVYNDGTKAQIVTAAGADNSHIALVGSVLSNGDEIINTPQSSSLIILRAGVPKAEDFLQSI